MTDPQSVAAEAERATLGGLLIATGEWPPEVERLTSDHFICPVRAKVFKAMMRLRAAEEPIDTLTAYGALAEGSGKPPKGGWAGYLSDLADKTPTAANLEHHAGLVLRECRRRDYVDAMGEAVEAAKIQGANADEIATAAIIRLGRISDGREIARPTPMREVIKAELEGIDDRRKTGEVIGHPTGFDDLDRLICGLVPGHLIVIAGRPSMGKSSFARNILTKLATTGRAGCLLFSLEMGQDEIGQAAIATEARVNLQRVRSGRLDKTQYEKIIAAMAALHTDRLAIVDRGDLSIAEIRTIARAYAARNPLGVVAVDYMQLVTGRGDNREQEIASISRGLKALGKELHVAVLALSQLNRGLEKRDDKRPRLSDLRESGAIEQDSDEVLFLYRDEYYNKSTEDRGIAEVGVAKSRNGPTGMVKLRWFGEFTRFESFES
jgi:replicative DNA helicase